MNEEYVLLTPKTINKLSKIIKQLEYTKSFKLREKSNGIGSTVIAEFDLIYKNVSGKFIVELTHVDEW